jgi:hypothetical protein
MNPLEEVIEELTQEWQKGDQTRNAQGLRNSIELPATMKLRSKVFHISFFELALKNAKLNTVTEADEDEEYDVEEILDFRISNGELDYLISSEGYLLESNLWEPLQNLNCPYKLWQFHRQNPDRPAPDPRKPSRSPKGDIPKARDCQ